MWNHIWVAKYTLCENNNFGWFHNIVWCNISIHAQTNKINETKYHLLRQLVDNWDSYAPSATFSCIARNNPILWALSVGLIAEFLELWAVISEVVLRPGVEDLHSWRFSSSDLYSAKSAYIELFQGAVLFGPWERIWRSWAPGKCHFFMCLVGGGSQQMLGSW